MMHRHVLGVLVAMCWSVVAWAQPPATAPSGARSASSAFYYTGTLRSTADCSASAVQAAINAAVAARGNGDIIRCPAGSSATWGANAVVIPDTIWLMLDANGVTVTRTITTENTPQMVLNCFAADDTKVTTIKGITFVSSITGAGANNGEYLRINCSGTRAPQYRLTDFHTIDTGNMGVHLAIEGRGYGLIDHCSFQWAGNQEVIQHGGPGAAGWADVVSPGTANQAYVEDCSFKNNGVDGFFVGGKVLAWNGARSVYRYTTWTCVTTDEHGNTLRRARWWEFYRNTYQTGAPCIDISVYQVMRGGSGFSWGNVRGTHAGGYGGIQMYTDADGAGCAAGDQVGFGQNQTLTPAYLFLNTGGWPELGLNGDGCTSGAGVIVPDVHVYSDFNGSTGVRSGTLTEMAAASAMDGQGWWAIDAGGDWDTTHGGSNDGAFYKRVKGSWVPHYTPYTYPHPFQTSLQADK